MKHYNICIILICFLCCSVSTAQSLSEKLDSLFEKGKKLYEEQKYLEATEVFNQLIEEGGTTEFQFIHKNAF